MSTPDNIRRLLVVSDPAPWVPEDDCTLGAWTLAVDRIQNLQVVPPGSRSWDVVAFRIHALGSMDPAAAMSALRQIAPDATFLPVAKHPEPTEALYFLKHGAFEYLEEPEVCVEPVELPGAGRERSAVRSNRQLGPRDLFGIARYCGLGSASIGRPR